MTTIEQISETNNVILNTKANSVNLESILNSLNINSLNQDIVVDNVINEQVLKSINNQIIIETLAGFTETDPLSLHLDKTTPQNIINGSASVIAPTSDLHIANKYYVDSNTDLDGGFANSVYLISQISDGGGA